MSRDIQETAEDIFTELRGIRLAFDCHNVMKIHNTALEDDIAIQKAVNAYIEIHEALVHAEKSWILHGDKYGVSYYDPLVRMNELIAEVDDAYEESD